MKLIIVLILWTISFLNTSFAQDSTKTDSLYRSIERTKEVPIKEKSLISKTIKVNIISTCSTKPELCGTMAFGSVSMVKIMEGDYVGDTIYVASTCTKTQYQIGQTYKLRASYGPGFSVILCNGKAYNGDWNYKLDENKYFIVFGSMF